MEQQRYSTRVFRPYGPAGSAEVRATALLYTLLICHLTLYPYLGWRELGVGAWEYWLTPWIPPHQKFLVTDASMNVLAYLPLGSLVFLSIPKVWRHYRLAALLAVLACSGLSACLEAIQTFLPARVPSKMDWLSNTLGAGLGIVLAHTVSRWLQRLGVLPAHTGGVLEAHSSHALVVMILWLFCLLAPLPLPFVQGPWLGDIWLFFAGLTADANADQWVAWLADIEESAQALASFLCLCGALCLGLAQTHSGPARLPLWILLMVSGFLIAWLGPQGLLLLQSHSLQSPLQLWGELSCLSVVCACLMGLCLALSDWKKSRLAKISLFCLISGYFCTLFLPGYSEITLKAELVPSQKTLEQLTAAANWMGALWPALAAMSAWRLSSAERA
jgi:VanZ family protein